MKGSVPLGMMKVTSTWTGCLVSSRLTAGREWAEGTGPAAATLAADPFELFRALSGRRSLDQVRTLAWDGDPAPYLDLLAPYPLPPSPPAE
jgi:hypothetical protein